LIQAETCTDKNQRRNKEENLAKTKKIVKEAFHLTPQITRSLKLKVT
jgi:hypothetical protein